MRLSVPLALLIFVVSGCDQSQGTWSWSCKATHDIQCSDGECEVAEDDPGIVPIEAYFDASGKVSMCVYSGCWEGDGQTRKTRQFHSIIGENLRWGSPDSEDFTDVFIAVNIGRSVGVAQVEKFVVPMICDNSPMIEEQ